MKRQMCIQGYRDSLATSVVKAYRVLMCMYAYNGEFPFFIFLDLSLSVYGTILRSYLPDAFNHKSTCSCIIKGYIMSPNCSYKLPRKTGHS